MILTPRFSGHISILAYFGLVFFVLKSSGNYETKDSWKICNFGVCTVKL